MEVVEHVGHLDTLSGVSLGSVAGIVELLGDMSPEVQAAAVDALLCCVDESWHEIANAIVLIEDLASNEAFPERKKAALLASKIMYHLDLLDEALIQALAADELFDIKQNTEYSHTMLAEAVSSYCAERQKLFDQVAKSPSSSSSSDDGDDDALKTLVHCSTALGEKSCEYVSVAPVHLKLEALVERMVEESWKHGKEAGEVRALGIALESRRLDLLSCVIRQSSAPSSLLKFCTNHCQQTISSKRFRFLFQMTIVELYDALFPVANRHVLLCEYTYIARALASTENYSRLADLLRSLISGESESSHEMQVLLAYQIAFDLVTFENQALLSTVLNQLEPASPLLPQQSLEASNVCSTDAPHTLNLPKETDYDDTTDKTPLLETSLEGLPSSHGTTHPTVSVSAQNTHTDLVPMETDKDTASTHASRDTLSHLKDILRGKVLLGLIVDFLHRENRTNLNLLDQLKNSVDPRSSVTPNGVVICHAFMQCGTTCDVFIRENLEWFGRAVCWAKFTVAAANGVLHKGHVIASKQVLSAYLPGSGGGPYSEGGSLYALGLIHANQFDESIRDYLLEQLQNAQRHCSQNYEPLQHGACLGLGLLGMGSNDSKIAAALRDILFTDSAVAGEAAAIGLGMIYVGSGSLDIAQELLNHAHETEHERTVRGASLGVAFVMYRKEEEALPLLEEMVKDKDPMIRYGGMFGLGLAFCGTVSHTALRRLLHIGVSDVSSCVRRAAVIAIGFVACGCPNQVPRLVSLLADSFNPHVRYAAALAIGIGCCGTASLAAVNILLPLTQDTTDFVRQGALLGLGLVLVQASLTALPDEKVETVRKLIMRIACDKHEDTITRFGAIVSQGLIDCGGRNGTISFYSSTNSFRAESAIGLAMFSQLWFWFPYILFGSLAFRPTFLVGLNKDLQAPSDFRLATLAPPGSFAYVEPLKKEKKEEKRLAVTAILSTASRRQQQEQIRKLTSLSTSGKTSTEPKNELEAGNTSPTHPSLEINEKGIPLATDSRFPTFLEQTSADAFPKPHDAFTAPPSTMPLPFALLDNPCRVVTSEEPYILLGVPESSWIPIDPERRSGVVMLRKVDSPSLPNESHDVPMVPESQVDPNESLYQPMQ